MSNVQHAGIAPDDPGSESGEKLWRAGAQRATVSAFVSVGFFLNAQPPLKGGGNSGARSYFTTKAPRHQESFGEYGLLASCLGVLVVQVVLAPDT